MEYPDRTIAVRGHRGDRQRDPPIVTKNLDRAPVQEHVKANSALPGAQGCPHVFANEFLPEDIVHERRSAQVEPKTFGSIRREIERDLEQVALALEHGVFQSVKARTPPKTNRIGGSSTVVSSARIAAAAKRPLRRLSPLTRNHGDFASRSRYMSLCRGTARPTTSCHTISVWRKQENAVNNGSRASKIC
jgi:hypothetical protein